MPETPCGWAARQVLPVPGVPGGGGTHAKPSSRHAASSIAPQHSAPAVHRQRPWSQTPDTQSPPSLQWSPANIASTPFASRFEHALPSPFGEQALFEGVTRSARKFPSTSATTGFSYQVHDEWYWLNSTSPVLPL